MPNQSHGASIHREPAGSGAVPSVTSMHWVRSADDSSADVNVFDLQTTGAAGAAFVKSAAESSDTVTVLDLTPGIGRGDATIVLVRGLAIVY